MNQVILYGRILEVGNVVNNDNKTKGKLVLEIKREYENFNGEYESDHVTINTYERIAVSVAEYLKKGEFVLVSGRVRQVESQIEIVAEKVTFCGGIK